MSRQLNVPELDDRPLGGCRNSALVEVEISLWITGEGFLLLANLSFALRTLFRAGVDQDDKGSIRTVLV